MQRAAGITAPYVSKLDEFEQFIQHAKLGMLPLRSTTVRASSHVGAGTVGAAHAETTKPQTTTQSAAAQHILLIEDLPFCVDAQQRQKLTAMLGTYRVRCFNCQLVCICNCRL